MTAVQYLEQLGAFDAPFNTGLPDDAFVIELYNRLFQRPPMQAGLTYWTDQMAVWRQDPMFPTEESLRQQMLRAIINGDTANMSAHTAVAAVPIFLII